MSGVRGFVAGVVGLSLLGVVTSDQHGEAGRVGDVFDGAASLLAWWLNPYTPLVPDLTNGEANPFGNPDNHNNIYIPSPKKDPEKRKPQNGGRVPGNPTGPGIRPGPGGISS